MTKVELDTFQAYHDDFDLMFISLGSGSSNGAET